MVYARRFGNPLLTLALSLFVLIAVGYVLVLAQGLLIPFVVAVFLWYLVNVLASTFGRIRIGHMHTPR